MKRAYMPLIAVLTISGCQSAATLNVYSNNIVGVSRPGISASSYVTEDDFALATQACRTRPVHVVGRYTPSGGGEYLFQCR
ncbi:hypothetical protein HOY34_10980 [Xinfangfangia sp. D13-10-4-6]|uniref:hypothetical protein n=1 Tax=Pseudogemmobacter hezensis TaxID=2737662 RepID=UPI001551C882|nr:hypothetical protein [Pseudogemmobacter hezensis]NPD15725.1 hypothetical protein [Pseudogemmobacter hezensis]